MNAGRTDLCSEQPQFVEAVENSRLRNLLDEYRELAAEEENIESQDITVSTSAEKRHRALLEFALQEMLSNSRRNKK